MAPQSRSKAARIDGGGWISVFTDITEIKSQEDVFRSHADDLTKELVQRSEDLASSNRELTRHGARFGGCETRINAKPRKP